MRILFGSATDAWTLASSNMVSTLPVTNLQSQYRELVARSTQCDNVLIEGFGPGPTALSMICLYRCNFTSTATWKVDIYADSSMATLLYTSGTLYASRPKALGELDWGVDPLGATLYTGFGSVISTLYFPTVFPQYFRITLQDPANPDGYLQMSRLFAGPYFEPASIGPETGATLTWNETTTNDRTEGGTLRSEPGVSYRSMSLRLGLMEARDRLKVSDGMRKMGMRGDGYISVFPGTNDSLERDHQMQFKLPKINPITIQSYFRYENQLDLEEV